MTCRRRTRTGLLDVGTMFSFAECGPSAVKDSGCILQENRAYTGREGNVEIYPLPVRTLGSVLNNSSRVLQRVDAITSGAVELASTPAPTSPEE
jgi:hypothetical protein